MNIPDSWPARLRGRLYTQFQSAPWAVSLANAVGAQQDAIQAAQVALLSLWSIDPITSDTSSAAYGVGRGVQLDRIGRLVGQPRSGADDESYRFYLRARIAANRSNGTVNDLIRVFKAMLGATEIPLYTPGGTASFIMQLSTPMTDAVAEIALYFLRYAKMAGVRALLETQEFPDSEMFYTALASYVASPVSTGDATIDVISTAGFPNSGSVIIDQGTADEETVAYSGRNGTTLYIPATVANNHSDNAAVQVVDSTGLGFPVSSATSASVAIGDGSIDVYDTTGFTNTGSIIIDEGLANEETLAYTSISPTTIFLSDNPAFTHDQDAAVVEVGTGGSLERVAV